MKKIIIVFAFFALVSCKENVAGKINKENLVTAKERDSKLNVGEPALVFDRAEHDFGVITQGDQVETIFSFKNTGKSELIITNATSTCGCTVPEWPKEPIAPGAEGEIKVLFNSAGKLNKVTKTITLTTNTATGKESVMIKTDIKPKEGTNS
tara:strand:- start:81177 stop:81632 length:456 start_codon:yes stop_codon:yes gene_type:complete